MSETKLIIEEPIEVKGQGITPKLRVWVARIVADPQIFSNCPTWAGSLCYWQGESLSRLPLQMFPELKEGDCKQYEITFREVKQ